MAERSDTAGFAPDGLEVCRDHPDGLVRHVFDRHCYVWPNGETSVPTHRTVLYECAECRHELRIVKNAEQS